MLPDDFGYCLLYAGIFIVFALIPLVLNFRDKYYPERFTFRSLLFLIGESGIIYCLAKAWSVIPPEGFWYYLKFAGFCFVLSLVPIVNFFALTPENGHAKRPPYDFLVNGILFLFFPIWAIYSVGKAWFSIPPEGFWYYLVFSEISAIIALVYIVYLKLNTGNKYDKKSTRIYLMSRSPFFVLMVLTIYFLAKAVSFIPPEIFYGLVFVLIVLFGSIQSSSKQN